MHETEVLIVGAGTAGATAAINLAPFRRVLLVENKANVMPRIGESLVSAARRLLADMGLLESFLAEGHEPWHGNRSVWGEAEPQEVDFLATRTATAGISTAFGSSSGCGISQEHEELIY